jgi:hypothetical protein
MTTPPRFAPIPDRSARIGWPISFGLTGRFHRNTQFQPPLRKRLPQVSRQIQTISGAFSERWFEKLERAWPFGLGLIHRKVGGAEETACSSPPPSSLRANADTEASEDGVESNNLWETTLSPLDMNMP